MSLFSYQTWQEVGNQLRDFKYKKKYCTPEQYVTPNPLATLVVPDGITDFFGTKVCNIFIVAQPYGWTQSGSSWTENWPPSGLEDAVNRHMDMYDKFTWYETHMYMDFNLVNRIMEMNPSSNFETMMNSTKAHLEAVCVQLGDFGFTMEDDIESEVGAEFFQPVIDEFIKNTLYVP